MSADVTPDATLRSGRGERVYSSAALGLLALLGAAVIVNGISLGVGSAAEPGAGMWPVVVGGIWTACAVAAAVAAWRGHDVLEPLDGLAKPASGAGLSILFVLLFSYVGFVVALVATLVLWLRLLTDYTWKRTALATAVVTAILYLLFAVIVGTPFPASLVGLA